MLFSYGDADVCASAKAPANAYMCSGKVAWEEARNACEDSGARLCSAAELLRGEATDSGCRYRLTA